MPAAPFTVVAFLQMALLIGFLVATALLFGLTLVNRLRLSGVLVTWRTGAVFRLPAGPLVFLVLVTALMTVAAVAQPAPPLWLFGGYLLGGGLWLAAASLASATVATRQGLVRHLNRPTEQLAWNRVVDYFARPERAGQRFVFFYLDARRQRQRFDVWVPAPYLPAFERVLRQHVDAHLGCIPTEVPGKKALEE